jgi:hypothetical protein
MVSSRTPCHAASVRSALRVLIAALATLLCTAPATIAQEEGVFVDPGSPTGKEYALPLDSARREADPSGGGTSAAPGTAPLFGAGIVASSASANATDGQDAGSTSGTSGTEATGGAGGAAEAPAAKSAGSDTEVPASKEAEAVVEAATRNPGAPSGGLSAPAVVALLAAGVLLAGGLAGVVIRRTRG